MDSVHKIRDVTLPGNTRRQGFTLTEIAIVLGIIGLILGAIWVAAGAVYNNLRVSKATTELLQIAQGVRSLYATQSTVDTGPGIDETSALIAARVFPSDTISTTTGANNAAPSSTADGPWAGSTIKVYSATQPNGIVGDSFEVQFVNIPPFACVSLATGNTGTGRDTALVGVGVSQSATSSALSGSITTFPITASVAATSCGTGTGSSIGFIFALRG